MERREYDKLNQSEDTLWWFGGLHANLRTAFQHCHVSPQHPILDAGCGTGGFLRKLAFYFPQCEAFGVDIDERACVTARTKSFRPVCVGSINSLPFADGSFAAIFSADVLYHKRVEEELALREFNRCLVHDGILVLNLPAYQWLSSGHDRAVHGERRYNRAGIHRILSSTGFSKVRYNILE